MSNDRRVRLWQTLTAALLWAVLAAPASATEGKPESLLSQARRCERAGDWSKACSLYASLLSKDPTNADLRGQFRTCLRHWHRARRHQDASYRQQVLGQDFATALRLYGEVLASLRLEFPDGDRTDLDRLFHEGLTELRLALNDETFRRLYVPDCDRQAVAAFLAQVDGTWGKRVVRYPLDAQSQALQVALAAKNALGLRPSVTVFEIVCGACNALDEYSYYLTPRQFGEEESLARGESVGVGLELAQVDGRLVVANVLADGPAAKALLHVGDQINRVGNEPAEKLTAESAADKLKGRIGTAVELEVFSPARGATRVSLTRQIVSVRSVAEAAIVDKQEGIGYVQLAGFHQTTPQEFDEAVRQLEMQGMRSLILDLRGNAGGLFDPAVLVAERFLEEGAAIVSTRGRAGDFRRTSHNVTPLLVPLVVLIDATTASAAEVLAGALKDNDRATLVGQATFGKTSVQQVVELKTVQAGGIRLTWARFFSPLSRPSGDGGITPHVAVDATPRSMYDDQLQAALKLLAGMSQ